MNDQTIEAIRPAIGEIIFKIKLYLNKVKEIPANKDNRRRQE